MCEYRESAGSMHQSLGFNLVVADSTTAQLLSPAIVLYVLLITSSHV
jgi:hypothetical protein